MITPQPQGAGQTLSVGPSGNGGTNYTVAAAGETWDSVYLGNNGAGTLNHSAGTLTITTQLWLGISSAGNGVYNLSGTGVLSSPTEIIGYSASAGATFNQNGGTNKTPSLVVAAYQGSSGTYNLNGGTLQAGSVTANITGLGSVSVFNFNGGTLQAAGSTGSFLQNLTYTNVKTGGAFIDSNGYNVTVNQSLLHDTSAGAPATDGGLTKLGVGTLTFNGGNTYRGTTSINAGTLAYGGGGGSSGGGNITLGGGNLLLNTSGTVTAGGITFTNGASSLTLQAGTLQVVAGGTISGGGGLIFQGGTLRAGGAFTISGGVPISIQAGGGTVDTTGGNITSGSGFGYSGGAAGSSAGTGTFTVQGGNLLKADFTSNSGWTGPVVVTGSGTRLQNNGGNYVVAGALTVGAGASYDLNNTGASFGGLAGAGTVLNTGGAGGPKTLTLTGAGGNAFSGNIAPAGGATEAANTALTIKLNNGGVQTLSGTNTYAGGTILAGGVLNVGSAGALGSTSLISFGGGTLQYSGNNQTDYSGRFSTAASQAYSIDTNGQNVTFASGLVSAGGTLTKLGGGTLTLLGANTYAGGTILAGGVLNVGSAGALGSIGTLSFAGGTLQYSSASTSDYSGRFSTTNNQAYILDTNGQNVTLANALTSTGGSLAKLGGGTLTLTGNNTYTGATTVNAGTLSVASSGGITGGGSLSVPTGGTLALGGTGTISASGESTVDLGSNGSGGTINQSGGTNTVGGTLAISQGTYNLSGTGALSAGTEFVGSGNLITNNSNLGIFNQSGGTNTVNGTLTVGDNINFPSNFFSHSTYNLSGTGVLSAANEVVGTISGFYNPNQPGLGLFNQTGGTNTVSGTLSVGESGPNNGGYAGTTNTYNLSGTGALAAATESIGNSSTGTFNQSGGTNTVGTLRVTYATAGTYNLSGAGALSATTEYIGYLGYTNGGVFNQTGGTNTVSGSLVVGTSTAITGALPGGAGTGTYNLSGTGTLAAATESIGDGSTGTFNQSGGTNTVSGTLSIGRGGNGTFNQSGGINTAGTLSLDGTYKLNGGTLVPGSVTSSNGGAGTFNFNGGTLRASGNNANFLQGLAVANVQGGGAIINTQGYNVTVAQNLVNNTASGTSDGGLTKLGSGTLTLAGTNTFNGPLNINAGVVAVTSESNLGAVTGALTVGGGGQLLFTGNATLARTYNLGVSTLGVASGQTLSFAAATVNNGTLAGPGTDLLANGTTLNGTRANSGATLSQSGGTVAFNNVTLSGNSTFAQAAGATLNTTGDFITTPQTTLAVSGTVNAQGGSVSGALTVNNGGTFNTTGGSSAPLYLDGSRGTTITAGGQLNAASGSTVELGGLLVNNGTQTGTLNVNLGGVARGTGSYGTVNVGQGGYFGTNALATGGGVNSGLSTVHLTGTDGLARTAFVGPQLMTTPGTANVASLTLGSGSVFAFNVQDAQGAAGSGYDLAHASGTLTLAAGTTAGNLITVSVASLNGNGTSGQAANFDPTKNYSFVLVQADGGIAGYQASEFVVDASGFQNAMQGGSFSVVQQGNNLDLMFNAVPEPSTWALLGLGGAALGVGALRRRTAVRA